MDRYNFLLACSLAVQRHEEDVRLQELTLQSELTSIRIYYRLCQFWDGAEVPDLPDLLTRKDKLTNQSVVRKDGERYERDGRKYERYNGIEYTVFE